MNYESVGNVKRSKKCLLVTPHLFETFEPRLCLTGEVIIDTFDTPQDTISLAESGSGDSVVSGDMLGGTRFIDAFFDTNQPGLGATNVGVSDGLYSLFFNNGPGSFGASGVIYSAPQGETFDFGESTGFQLDFASADPNTPFEQGSIDLTIFGIDSLGNGDAVTRTLSSNEGSFTIPSAEFTNFDLSSIQEIGISFASFAPVPSSIRVDRFLAAGNEANTEDPSLLFDANGNFTGVDTYLPLGEENALVKSEIDLSFSGAGAIDPGQAHSELLDGALTDLSFEGSFEFTYTIRDVDPDFDFSGLDQTITLTDIQSTLAFNESGAAVDTSRPNFGLSTQIDMAVVGATEVNLPNGSVLNIPEFPIYNSFNAQTNGEGYTTHYDSGFSTTGAFTDIGGNVHPIIFPGEGGFTVTESPAAVDPVPFIHAPKLINVVEDSVFPIDTIRVGEFFPSSDDVRVALTPFNTDTFTFIGTTSLANTDGLTFFDGDGTDDQNVFFSGSLASVNDALNGLNLNVGSLQPGKNVLNVVISNADESFVKFNEVPLNIHPDASILANPDSSIAEEGTGPIVIEVQSNDQVLDTSSTVTISAINDTVVEPELSVPTDGGGSARVTGSTITYTPPNDPDFFGTETFTYTISRDNDIDTGTVTVDIKPVNDAPQQSVAPTQTTPQNTPVAISGLVSVSDDAIETIKVDLLAAGTLDIPSAINISVTEFGGRGKSVAGTVADINNALGSVTYTPPTDFVGTDMLQVTTFDMGQTGTGGAKIISDSVDIVVTPINDTPLPTVVSDSFALEEDNELTISIADLLANDEPVGVDSTLSITRVNRLPLVTQTFSTVNGSLTFDSETGLFTYEPASNFFGTDTFTYTIESSPDEGDGPAVGNVTLDIQPINDGPVNTLPSSSSNQTTDEDTPLIFSSSNNNLFSVFDVDSDSLTVTLNVDSGTVTLPAGDGTVTGSGTNGVTISGTPSQINGRLDGLTYTPPADFFGNVPITVKTTDGPGLIDEDTLSITIQPINDLPLLVVPGSQTVNEDESLSLNGVSISDVDSSDLVVTLSVNNGIVSVSDCCATVTNNGSSSPSLEGTIGQINDSLSGLSYVPAANFNGSEQLTVTARDLPTENPTTDTVNITIHPINDPPVLVVPGKQSFFTDFDNRFSSEPAPFKIEDVDGGDGDFLVQLAIDDGVLSLTESNGITLTPSPQGESGLELDGSLSAINEALQSLQYTPSTPGEKTLNVIVNDQGNTGGGSLEATSTVEVEVLDFVPATLTGQVFIDADSDNEADSNEPGIDGVDVILSGTDFQGNPVQIDSTTDSNGIYTFDDLKPNSPGTPYTIEQVQPVFIQNGSSNQAQINVTVDGVEVEMGSPNFTEVGLISPFDEIFRPEEAASQSGILFGSVRNAIVWSFFFGTGWDTSRYTNARLVVGDDDQSATLTVFDVESGIDKSTNVTQSDGTLIVRGSGDDKVFRVVGADDVLQPEERLVGDADGDGVVGMSDFIALSMNFGKQENATLAEGDFDGNGKIEFRDFLLLAANFGQRLPNNGSVSISAVDQFFATSLL